MGLHDERYFFFGGLISLSIFLTLLLVLGYSVSLTPKTDHFAMRKSDVIVVSIDTPSIEPIPNPPQTPAESLEAKLSEPVEAENIEKTQESIQKTETSSKPVPDISDLFGDIKPQKTSPKPKEQPRNQETLNRLEQELTERKEASRFSDKVRSVEVAKPSVKMLTQESSAGPQVNEYYAKIQSYVYTYFRPPQGSIGESSRIRIKISASGKLLSYSVVSYSKNSLFNGEVDWLHDKLSTIRFPEHPDKKDAVLEFILTARE
jgi:hypothetical protein